MLTYGGVNVLETKQPREFAVEQLCHLKGTHATTMSETFA